MIYSDFRSHGRNSVIASLWSCFLGGVFSILISSMQSVRILLSDRAWAFARIFANISTNSAPKVCQMLSWWTKIILHSINIWDTDTKVAKSILDWARSSRHHYTWCMTFLTEPEEYQLAILADQYIWTCIYSAANDMVVQCSGPACLSLSMSRFHSRSYTNHHEQYSPNMQVTQDMSDIKLKMSCMGWFYVGHWCNFRPFIHC